MFYLLITALVSKDIECHVLSSDYPLVSKDIECHVLSSDYPLGL